MQSPSNRDYVVRRIPVSLKKKCLFNARYKARADEVYAVQTCADNRHSAFGVAMVNLLRVTNNDVRIRLILSTIENHAL